MRMVFGQLFSEMCKTGGRIVTCPICPAVTKQINDKERVAAAMENKNIKEMVQSCVSFEAL